MGGGFYQCYCDKFYDYDKYIKDWKIYVGKILHKKNQIPTTKYGIK